MKICRYGFSSCAPIHVILVGFPVLRFSCIDPLFSIICPYKWVIFKGEKFRGF